MRSSIPNLVGQIHKRASRMKTLFLLTMSRLNERYEGWIQTYDKGKLLIIETTSILWIIQRI
jgi:hypothetical protein